MIIEIDDHDVEENFLSQIAQAEAAALSSINSNKRRRNIEDTDGGDKSKILKSSSEEEGAYTAALRGSKSVTWQHSHLNKVKTIAAPAPAYNRFNGGSGGDEDVAEKKCPCGIGYCVVLTANTERNRGRKFYRCPARRENGGCDFFEWCDNASGASNMSSMHGYVSNSTLSDVPCPCGAGFCLVLTAKTGKNVGQQFYKCPANQASSCGFFKWCDDSTTPANPPSSNVSMSYNKNMDPNSNNSSSNVVRSGSSCFKCGKDGHWARDCLGSTSESRAQTHFGGKSASSAASSSCYKCGQSGHWARDCHSSTSASAAQTQSRGGPVSSAASGVCYKCGQPGHWARDCSY